jgi:sulfofructose kinase
VICAGSAVLDRVFRVDAFAEPPAKIAAVSLEEGGGGCAAGAAIAIARLGGAAVLWTRVGADDAGALVLRELSGEGVEVSNARVLEGVRTPRAAVIVDRRGERLIVSHVDERLHAGAEGLPLEQIAGARAVLVDVRWPAAALAVLERAKREGVRRIVDVDLGPQARIEEIAALASDAIFSAPALAEFAATEDRERGLRAAARLGAPVVGVTAGEQGAWWLEAGVLHHQPAHPVRSLDTTGAGDVFHGAYALAVAEGRSVAQAMRFASVAAALKCTRAGGGRGCPARAEVESRLAGD